MHARFISFFDAPILLPVKSNAHFVKVKIITYISLIRRSFAIFNLVKKLLQRSKSVLLSLMALGNRVFRVRPRFFDQVEHETMYASSGNKHFFTKSCHR